jgi:hypothetical protein
LITISRREISRVQVSWRCSDLQEYGFPSPTAAGKLGRTKLHEVQELVGDKFRLEYDRERCRFTLSRGAKSGA